MKLELGKKYVLRNDPNTKWVRVESITDELRNSECVRLLKCTPSGNFEFVTRYYDGSYAGSNAFTMFDIVAEYKEPELCITEKDVGRKVRLRSGDIFIIISFRASMGFPVGLFTSTCRANGQSGCGSASPEDIIGFVD